MVLGAVLDLKMSQNHCAVKAECGLVPAAPSFKLALPLMTGDSHVGTCCTLALDVRLDTSRSHQLLVPTRAQGMAGPGVACCGVGCLFSLWPGLSL